MIQVVKGIKEIHRQQMFKLKEVITMFNGYYQLTKIKTIKNHHHN